MVLQSLFPFLFERANLRYKYALDQRFYFAFDNRFATEYSLWPKICLWLQFSSRDQYNALFYSTVLWKPDVWDEIRKWPTLLPWPELLAFSREAKLITRYNESKVWM